MCARNSLSAAHLVWHICAQIHTQCHVQIDWFHHIAKFLTALQFVLHQPFLQQILLILHKHRSAQFECFVFIQLTGVEQNREVLQQRTWLTWYGRAGDLLEFLNGRRRPQYALYILFVHVRFSACNAYPWCSGSDACRLGVVLIAVEHVELANEQLLGTWQIATNS
jgi:hypothetical protein